MTLECHSRVTRMPVPFWAGRMSRVWLFSALLAAAIVAAHSLPRAQERAFSAQPPQPAKADGELAADEKTNESGHSEGLLPTIAKLFNFAMLAGVLVYFLKAPIKGFLESRSVQIRQELLTASEMRAAASAQLAEIERRLKALPAELEALKMRGAEDVRAERVRIQRAAAAERERLRVQMRREIDMRLRLARRELVEYGARLAVEIARARIERSITPEDQLRLVDRYATQLEAAQ